jgi:hypothetical protein
MNLYEQDISYGDKNEIRSWWTFIYLCMTEYSYQPHLWMEALELL